MLLCEPELKDSKLHGHTVLSLLTWYENDWYGLFPPSKGPLELLGPLLVKCT